MSVYTRFGDKGKTSLYGGKSVSKASTRVETYGTLDELNSFLGVAISGIKDKKIKAELIKVQNDLFEIGTSLASLATNKNKTLSSYLEKREKEFEKKIDDLTKKLPELENFILPGGSSTGANLHFVRTLARRAERRIVKLNEEDKILPQILIYLNRLSDLIFMYARLTNLKAKQEEVIWKTR